MWQTGTIRRQPQTYALRANDLNWLINQYIEACRSKSDNPATVDCYLCKLRWFTDWWNETGPKQAWMLHHSDLIAFERHLRTAKSERTKRTLSWHSRHYVLRRLREAFH